MSGPDTEAMRRTPATRGRPPRRRSPRMFKRNIAAIVLAALVVGVGAYAWAEGAPPDPTTSTTPPGASGAPAAKPHRPGRAARLPVLRRAVHGDVVVKDKAGKFVTVT